MAELADKHAEDLASFHIARGQSLRANRGIFDEHCEEVAAVVMPLTLLRECRMAPAPRNPMPVTICAATRPESPVVVTKAKETMVNTAEPRHTRLRVRRPAGLSCRSRSRPMMAPQATATIASRTSSQGEGSSLRKLRVIQFTAGASLRLPPRASGG